MITTRAPDGAKNTLCIPLIHDRIVLDQNVARKIYGPRLKYFLTITLFDHIARWHCIGLKNTQSSFPWSWKKQIRKSAPPQREQEFPPQIVHKDCITAVADLVIPFVEECRWFWSDTKAPLLPSCGNTALLSVCQAKHSSALSSMCVQRPHLEWGGQPGWDLTIYWKSWRTKNSFKWGDWHIWCFLLNPGLWSLLLVPLISKGVAFKRGIKCKLDGLKLLYLMSSA